MLLRFYLVIPTFREPELNGVRVANMDDLQQDFHRPFATGHGETSSRGQDLGSVDDCVLVDVAGEVPEGYDGLDLGPSFVPVEAWASGRHPTWRRLSTEAAGRVRQGDAWRLSGVFQVRRNASL
eukprot:762577-Hanusia_phi.AAC.2